MSSYRAYAVKRTGRKFIYITILRDGKFWKSRSSGKTVMREAQREAAELEAGLNSPNKETAEFGPITWSDFCDNYRVSEMLGMRESSRDKVDTVMRDVARIAKPYILSDLTALKIADIVTEYRRGGAQETTIKSKVATLRAMLSWAKRVNMLDEIPAMPRVRAGTKSTAMKGRPLTEDEYAQLRSRAAAPQPGSAKANGCLSTTPGTFC